MYVSGCVGTVSVPNCFHSTLPESFTRELLLEAKMHTHSIVSTILHLSTEFETSFYSINPKTGTVKSRVLKGDDFTNYINVKHS
jgi:hypothetical protein